MAPAKRLRYAPAALHGRHESGVTSPRS